jgi:MFS family permease
VSSAPAAGASPQGSHGPGPAGGAASSAALAPGYTDRSAWFLVFSLTACSVVSQVDRMAMTLLVTPMQRDLGLSDTDIGVIGGLAFGLFYAIAGLPIASLSDRFSRRVIIITALVGWSVMTALCGLAVGYWTLFLARVLVAVGEAALGPASNSMLSNVFPPSRLSKPLSVFALGGSLGNTVAALLVAGLLALAPWAVGGLTFGGQPFEPWRFAFLGLAVVGILPVVLLLANREPPRGAGAQGAPAPPLGELLRYIRARWRAYAPCYLGYTLLVLPVVAISFWTPTAYERVHGIAAPVAGAWLGIGYVVGGVTGTLFGGWLADYWNARGRADGKVRVLATAIAGVIPAAVGSQLAPDFWLGIAFLWSAMFFAGMGLGPVSAAIQGMTPPRLRARASAVLYMLVNLIAFGGVPIAGVINDALFGRPETLNYALAIVAAGIGSLALCVVLWGLPHYRRLVASESPG